METETRRIVVAMLVALALFIGYQYVINQIYPPRPQPTAPVTPVQPQPSPAAPPGAATPPVAGVTGTAPTATSLATTAPERTYSFAAAEESEPVPLGGDEGDALRIRLDPRGAALASLELYAKDSKGRFVQRTQPNVNEPYELLRPLDDGTRLHFSYATYRIWIQERDNQSWRLDELRWKVAERSPHKAVFTTVLGSGQAGDELLRLTKTYELQPEEPVFDLILSIENTSPASLTVRVEQDGPLGIPQESQQYDMRSLLTAQRSTSGVELNRAQRWEALRDASRKGEALPLLVPDKGPFLWTALADKYFAVYTRPLPRPGDTQDCVASVSGLAAAPHATANLGDLLARIASRPVLLGPGAAVYYPFEIYAGPKDGKHLRQVNPDFADKGKLYYQLAQSVDGRCFCAFLSPLWLQELMVWLLEKIHLAVRNYGVAIMVLVIIIRSLLHPLTVWQQKSMFRMQEAMARIQPKLEAVKEKYANDKVKQNQEMMRLFGEEGVNPAANFVSFIPLLIQMPILIALWTALNTDVNLRHAPFDGWWIVDLSAPDAFLSFNPPVTVPVLGQLPLIGTVFAGITSLNLLPILMGISMWLQQKYMPKPHHVQAKLEAARAPAAEPHKPSSGMSPEAQLRQQRIMAYMMAIVFPLMFYKMQSGLNLYWLSTNIFGICESLIIRKQINEEKARRAHEGPRPPGRKPGLLGRFFKHIAAQAEDLQRKADRIAHAEPGRKKDAKKKP